VARAAAGAGVPPQERHTGGYEIQVETVRRPDGTVVQAILDLAANHGERDRLVATMLVAGGVALLLAGAAGAWFGRRALRPLSSALGLQRRFVADAGHELRTPVTLLSTRAQLLRRTLRRAAEERQDSGGSGATTSAAALADLDGIVADSARLGEILEELLLAADPLSVQPRERVDLTDTLVSVVAAAAAAAQERGVVLSGPGPGRVVVRGSPAALRRGLTALVDNAVRHARAEVTVEVTAPRGRAWATVADDGPGIDPELAPRLFQRFVTGDATAGDGDRRRSGLGLALVGEIAAAHDGTVTLVEHSGPGATFRLDLPAEGLHSRPGRRPGRGRRRGLQGFSES
jgi:two-component system OmpR family sensor kinase